MTVRVATTQYRTGNDVDANLQTLLGLIEEAAAGGAQLVVAPEFGNHTSFYEDAEQAWAIAVEPDGAYVQAVRDKAAEKGIHVVFNATTRGREPGRVFDTAIGRIGMMSCLDGVPPECARNLGVRGAQIVTNGHNSCALDEPYTHIPVSAAENHVWVIASGKVGPVCVDEMLQPLADQVGIPAHLISSIGENPILNPMGEAVARFECQQGGVLYADIDVEAADDKSWADGDLFTDRRPELYGPLVEPPVEFPLEVAAPYKAGIIQLDTISANMQQALEQSAEFESRPASLCREIGVAVACSLVTEDGGLCHTGVLIGDDGICWGRYHQTHLCHSYRSWARAGDELPVWNTPLGSVAMMVGYDAVFPEVATVLARRGAEVILHPTAWRLPWEPSLVICERASENRVSILSAARSDSAVERGGMINALSLSAPLRASDLNPIWPVEAPRDRELHLLADIHPERSRNKDLIGFDLQRGRRVELYEALVGP